MTTMQNDRYSIKDWVILFSSAIVTFLLLIAGIAEAGYGLLQLLGICPSRHPLYPVTGSFYNPGPFGCYLSFTVPLAIAEFCYGKHPILRYTAAALLLLDALILPVSMSRTAWLASALGALIVFSPKIIRLFRTSPRFYTLLAIAGLSVSLWGVYSIKADSADGRLLMWKVAVRAVNPSPYSSDPMPLNIIGKNFQQLNLPDSAEHYLTRAAFRCPNRLYPHYLLMKLYTDPSHPQKEKAMREARLILSKEVKIKSPAADDIRREAKELLNDLSNEIPSAPEKDI